MALIDPAPALALAVRAAERAAETLLTHFRDRGLVVETKADGTPVSRADREAENIIVSTIRADATFGAFDVLGEESGGRGTGSRLRWVIDPLDGTLSYTHGFPFWGTLIALEDVQDGTSIVGVAHFPALGWTYAAALGDGATRNGTPIRVTSETDPGKTILGCPDDATAELAGQLTALRELRSGHSRVRGYWDCVSHVLAAEGAFGAVFDVCLAPWDLAATRLIVTEAGGEVRTRPSAYADTTDALLGAPAIVAALAPRLRF